MYDEENKEQQREWSTRLVREVEQQWKSQEQHFRCTFPCAPNYEVCTFVGRLEDSREHFSRHTGRYNYQCAVCKEKFLAEERARDHIKMCIAREKDILKIANSPDFLEQNFFLRFRFLRYATKEESLEFYPLSCPSVSPMPSEPPMGIQKLREVLARISVPQPSTSEESSESGSVPSSPIPPPDLIRFFPITERQRIQEQYQSQDVYQRRQEARRKSRMDSEASAPPKKICIVRTSSEPPPTPPEAPKVILDDLRYPPPPIPSRTPQAPQDPRLTASEISTSPVSSQGPVAPRLADPRLAEPRIGIYATPIPQYPRDHPCDPRIYTPNQMTYPPAPPPLTGNFSLPPPIAVTRSQAASEEQAQVQADGPVFRVESSVEAQAQAQAEVQDQAQAQAEVRKTREKKNTQEAHMGLHAQAEPNRLVEKDLAKTANHGSTKAHRSSQNMVPDAAKTLNSARRSHEALQESSMPSKLQHTPEPSTILLEDPRRKNPIANLFPTPRRPPGIKIRPKARVDAVPEPSAKPLEDPQLSNCQSSVSQPDISTQRVPPGITTRQKAPVGSEASTEATRSSSTPQDQGKSITTSSTRPPILIKPEPVDQESEPQDTPVSSSDSQRGSTAKPSEASPPQTPFMNAENSTRQASGAPIGPSSGSPTGSVAAKQKILLQIKPEPQEAEPDESDAPVPASSGARGSLQVDRSSEEAPTQRTTVDQEGHRLTSREGSGLSTSSRQSQMVSHSESVPPVPVAQRTLRHIKLEPLEAEPDKEDTPLDILDSQDVRVPSLSSTSRGPSIALEDCSASHEGSEPSPPGPTPPMVAENSARPSIGNHSHAAHPERPADPGSFVRSSSGLLIGPSTGSLATPVSATPRRHPQIKAEPQEAEPDEQDAPVDVHRPEAHGQLGEDRMSQLAPEAFSNNREGSESLPPRQTPPMQAENSARSHSPAALGLSTESLCQKQASGVPIGPSFAASVRSIKAEPQEAEPDAQDVPVPSSSDAQTQFNPRVFANIKTELPETPIAKRSKARKPKEARKRKTTPPIELLPHKPFVLKVKREPVEAESEASGSHGMASMDADPGSQHDQTGPSTPSTSPGPCESRLPSIPTARLEFFKITSNKKVPSLDAPSNQPNVILPPEASQDLVPENRVLRVPGPGRTLVIRFSA